ncbi:MAG: glycoside hydrolase family 43 protein [Bernardetiaceae bacterium]|jgi:beta-xylosidase|nr:glycoside hydrolase family 43 protein [Bernardetiaceae bacterium]
MRKFLLPILGLLALVWFACGGGNTPAGQEAPTDSLGTKTSGNPIFPGWYADPEAIIIGDRYWIFPTFSDAFDRQVFLDAFSSADLVNWTKHPRIIDTTAVKWAKQAMWAPAILPKDGKYYLFFSANDVQNPQSRYYQAGKSFTFGGIGVAVADRPEGPYRDLLGKPLVSQFYNQAQPIDQCVFQDTTGQYYMVYGGWRRCNLARLKPDFSALEPFADGDTVKEITPEGYVEGPIMFRHRGLYYLMWSEGNWTDSTYRVAYGTAATPLGPFARQGTILQADTTVATGAGHHSVLHPPGTTDWYVVYHRRPIPSQGRDHRVVCIDKMEFAPDGSIKPVRITFEGVPARPLTAKP